MRRFWEILKRDWTAGWREIGSMAPWREVMLYCLPALLVAIIVRTWLWSQVPTAFVNSDVRSIVSGSIDLVRDGEFKVGSRRTFLGPILYAIPLFLHLPLLPSVAFFQHLLGIILVPVTGAISALWFRKWRAWIVPLTLLMAVDAFLLVFEHVALPDYLFAFFLTVMFLFATIFYRKPGALTLVLLLVGMFFVVGARQEGRYYCMVPLALSVVAFWGEWRRMGASLAAALVFSMCAFATTETTQSGQMLLASTLQLMPEDLKTAPGLPEKLVPLRKQVEQDWTLYPAQHNSTRKEVRRTVKEYLASEKHLKPDEVEKVIDGFCKKAAAEVISHQPWRLPVIGFRKFMASHNETPSRPVGLYDHIRQHLEVFFDKEDPSVKESEDVDAKSKKYIVWYYGRNFATREELREFFLKIYPERPVKVLYGWEERFINAMLAIRLPDIEKGPQSVIGFPLLYMIAVAGIVALAIREGRGINLYWILLFAVAGVAFLMFTAANTRARYRISLEPLWWLGFFAFCDVTWTTVTSFLRKNQAG